jgi:hypothetical protein
MKISAFPQEISLDMRSEIAIALEKNNRPFMTYLQTFSLLKEFKAPGTNQNL